MPLKATDCGEPVALSVITTLEVRVPVVDGLNVTLTLQEPLTARLAGHVLAEMAKSPDVLMELMATR